MKSTDKEIFTLNSSIYFLRLLRSNVRQIASYNSKTSDETARAKNCLKILKEKKKAAPLFGMFEHRITQ